MKIKIICIILTVVFIALCSCSKTQTDTPSGMKLASDDAADYYMYVPDGWEVADHDGLTCAYVSINDRSNVSCARYVIKDEDKYIFDIPENKEEGEPDAALYAEKYWDNYVEGLKTHPGYNPVFGPKKTTLNKLPAVRYSYNLSSPGKEYTCDIVVCIKDRQFAYLLTYTAETSSYETNLPSFEKILEEFVFQTGLIE